MSESEREKMLRGALYLASEPELVEMRNRARRLWLRFNASDPGAVGQRLALLREMLGSVGPDAWVEPPFYCDYGAQVTLEAGVYVNMNCVFLDCAPIRIGAQGMLGPAVQLLTATHPVEASARSAGPEMARPITIGARCWLGGGVIVLPGVNIGEGTTIGAGSVVARDIPAGVIAVGNPCRVVRAVSGG